MTDKKTIITFEPVGLRVEAHANQTILNAAREAGIAITSVCGGAGTCGKCKVRIMRGEVRETAETECLTSEEKAQRVGLACRMQPASDALTVYIPPESLAVRQQLQVECHHALSTPDNDLQVLRLNPPAPTLEDLRDDATRVREHLESLLGREIVLPFTLLKNLSNELRAAQWDASAVVLRGRLVAALPTERRPFGLAVDMGTTKVAAYLVDLQEGRVVDSEGNVNGQTAYGEDVISRMGHANESPAQAEKLHQALCDTINSLIEILSKRNELIPEQWVDAVLVGNTAIHHLFAGLPVRQLGMAPYVPAVSAPIILEAGAIGLAIHPAASVYFPSILAGYVGCDHVAALTTEKVYEAEDTVMLCDIGTNTEITLRHNGQMCCCSCASGPAFEGAHLRQGMRASRGAIDHVVIRDGAIRCSTIEQAPPIGICGSGVLDALAQFLQQGMLTRPGGLDGTHDLVEMLGKERAVCLDRDAPVFITQSDVSVIQLAKGAIRAGIDILLEHAGITYQEVDRFILAGAFGTYIDPASAAAIGMIPPWPPTKVAQVGNAAGRGAVQMLLSDSTRSQALNLGDQMNYVELTAYPKFHQKLARAMLFGRSESPGTNTGR